MSANLTLLPPSGGSSGSNVTIVGPLTGSAVTVDGSGVTQPVSAAALPLPAGASTEATLSAINGKTATLVGGRTDNFETGNSTITFSFSS